MRYERLPWPQHQRHSMPVYQRNKAADGAVMFLAGGYGQGYWCVGHSPARLTDCDCHMGKQSLYSNEHCTGNPDDDGCAWDGMGGRVAVVAEGGG